MNVLVIVLDDTHYDAFAQMPYLSSFPDGRWTVFNKATHSNPYCGPSRIAMNTGRTSASTGTINHGIGEPSTIETWEALNARHLMPVWLRGVGYRTGHTGKYINGYPWNHGDSYIPPGQDSGSWHAQIDDGAPNRTCDYINYTLCENGATQLYAAGDPWTTTGADASGRTITTPKYFSDKANLLARTHVGSGSQPWYYNLSERASHGVIIVANRHSAAPTGGLPAFSVASPTVHTRPSFNQAAGADWNTMPAWVRAKPLLNTTEINDAKTDQTDQWRAVQSVDEGLRDIVTVLKATSQFDNTVICLLSDNGWARGEHRLQKKNVVYEPSIRTNIWMRHPSAPLANRTSSALVQNTDLGVTICEIAGARPTQAVNGQSFLRLVLSGTDTGWRQSVYVDSYEVDGRGTPGFTAVVTADGFKYVELDSFSTFAAEKELYDLNTHPDETRNVINDVAYVGVKADLAQRLNVLRTAAAA